MNIPLLMEDELVLEQACQIEGPPSDIWVTFMLLGGPHLLPSLLSLRNHELHVQRFP